MDYTKVSDTDLVLLTLSGESSAYEELVLRYQSVVILSAKSVCKNLHIAEDAAQDAFVNAWLKLNMLNEAAKFAPWVCRIAKNCALNLTKRYERYAGLTDEEWAKISSDDDVEDGFFRKEERFLLCEKVEKLPEKIKDVIRCYYFDGLSVSQIAKKSGVSVGTVKRQLFDGRQILRKDLEGMNVKEDDTFTEKIMKRLEEIKLSSLNNCSDEFKTAFANFEEQLKAYPESREKNEALSYVMAQKYLYNWNMPEESILAKIEQIAEKGKNEELLALLYMTGLRPENADKHIEKLIEKGFNAAAGEILFRHTAYARDKYDENYERILKLLPESSPLYTAAKICREFDEPLPKEKLYSIYSKVFELRNICKKLRLLYDETQPLEMTWKTVYENPIKMASYCDRIIYDEKMKPGDSFLASDDKVLLSFIKNDATVDTGFEKFYGCELWQTSSELFCTKIYIKPNIGIVMAESVNNGKKTKILLKAYDIKGGTGKIPFFKGNRWEYTSAASPEFITHSDICYVTYADGDKVIIGSKVRTVRKSLDESNFEDMVDGVIEDYIAKEDALIAKLCNEGKRDDEVGDNIDMSGAYRKLNDAAKTNLEKTYAASLQQGLEKHLSFAMGQYQPQGFVTVSSTLIKKNNNGTVYKPYNNIHTIGNNLFPVEGEDSFRISFSDLYSICSDATGFLWSEKWQKQKEVVRTEKNLYSFTITTYAKCSDAGTITTAAGSFENCVKLEIRSTGQPPRSWSNHRLCNKEYYFAPGVGLVRAVTLFGSTERALFATYDLAEYRGTGEGYMPFCDGFYRKYEETDLETKNIAVAEYKFVNDGDNTVVVECIYGGTLK